jgi:glutathionyl-hydroquinone reductase
MGEDGWTFLEEDGATGDTLYGLEFLHQIYTKADPEFTGRVTVPVLWDKKRRPSSPTNPPRSSAC